MVPEVGLNPRSAMEGGDHAHRLAPVIRSVITTPLRVPWKGAAFMDLQRAQGQRHRRARRLLVSVAEASAMATMVAMTFASSAMATPTSGPSAPAVDGAANGGAVIVVLKVQHTDMNMRTQAAAVRGATAADQAPVVAAIKADGGTNLAQVSEPSEVAATLSAAAVASLEANSAVAQIIPDPQVQMQPSGSLAQPPAAAQPTAQPAARPAKGASCPFNPDPGKPLQEGEANIDIHASDGTPAAP